ncbi:NYN domain-containing protein [Rhizobacter sp. AJA081-3]|uniref:NYN domain-containing protein n=1 Tax=Rhizobacter sp. AJA081-3 TaxID=2753607 RepID=UPI001AE0B1C5|nr:NYN domain-containing protein [Rhizobacter sp. AJA081-3]QTN21785.1 NYN domain-containing protein [Rhizobacter sp. AJA081-3]
MKSALFVDFDNVYSGLKRLDPGIAERFAFQPLVWIRWLTDSLQAPPHAPAGSNRRLLVRRCYLNPQVYQRFRPAFNRAGFEIIDCPAMTSEGKTSTDIHMVLDIVDLLQHEAHYDEFIVFSADADFTPVLRKLRRWDRRTTVLAIGFPSAAYQASADLLIDQDEFVRGGLGFEDVEDIPPAAEPVPPQADVARSVARFITRTVASSAKPISLPWLAGKVPGEVRGLDAATWSGFNTFRALVDSLQLAPLAVNWELGLISDPARHTLPDKVVANGPKGAGDSARELSNVAQLVRSEVAKARRPVPCGRLAQLITEQHGKVASDWAGKGTFRKFLEALDLSPLKVDWSSAGGSVLDPTAPAIDGGAVPSPAALDWGPFNHLLALIGQVHTATELPMLSPPEIRFLLGSLVADVAERPFLLTETGKRVRDRCREAGESISRADVSFVLKGILLGGHTFGQGRDDADTLGARFVDSVLALCQREQLILDDSQVAMFREWVAGPGGKGAAPRTGGA